MGLLEHFVTVLPLVPQAVVTSLLFGMIFALVAAGLALIWGVADVVNFAHGEYMLVAMYITLFGSRQFGIDPLLILPFNALILFAAGYGTYVLVISRIMKAPMLAQIFATFSLVLIIRFGALLLAGPYTFTLEQFVFRGNTTVAGVVVSYPQLVTALVSALALGLLFLFLRGSKTGKAIRATSQDWEVARVLGIDTDRIFALTWGLGIATTGVAGTLVVTFSPVQPELTPTTWTLISFTAVALGGFGNILGAVAGGVVIAFVEHVGAVLLNPSYKELYVFGVFIAVLLFKPEGILNWGES